MIIAGVVSFVILVLYVTWRKTPIQNPLNPTKIVALWNQYPLTRDKANSTTQRATLPTELTLLPTHTNITEIYEKSLQSPSSIQNSLPTDANTTTQHATLPAELTLLPNHTNITEMYEKSLQPPSIPDTMPYPRNHKEREILLKAEWISALYTFLQTLDKSVSPHVNLVFGDDNHRRLVMNWVTAALKILKPPLHNVMVLSLHHSLCDYLKARTLPLTCITVTPDSLFTFPNSKEVDYGKGVMVRLPVLRLINYWGYDVAAYDCDAVLLRNPQVLYSERQQVDVFSASGTYPFDISRKWGFTLCAGTIILRASPATGNH